MVRRSPRRFARTLRVNEVVREVLGDELERLADPRLEMVTVTGVEVSPDLRHAIVYFAALGNHDPGIVAALESSAPRLKRSLAREARLKYVPALHFREDPAIESGQRVEEILRELHRQADP
ncbi:MAG TPA: 30S ribosome-binding factor RbfA [Acidimicrobiia bacterium]|nr:30S ribosome-binding factor RbfA [Acidimicrobiia bacterium]